MRLPDSDEPPLREVCVRACGAAGEDPGFRAVVLAVVRKEIRDLARNRTLLISLIVPVLLAVLLIWALEHAQSAAVARIALLRGTDGQLHSLLAVGAAFDLSEVDSVASARERVESGAVDAALLIPSDFDACLRNGSLPAVTLVVPRGATPRTASAAFALTEVLRLRAGQRTPVSLSLEAVGRDARSAARGQWLVGFVVFELLMGFGIVATSLVEERERGTMQAIRVTGASTGAVLVGKAAVAWALCLMAGVLMVGLCGLLHPPVAGLLAVLAAGCGFSVALGAWMGVVYPNLAAANAGLPVVFMAIFVPAFLETQVQWAESMGWMPGNLLMRGLRQTLVEAAGLEVVWGCVGSLMAYAIGCAAAAWLTQRLRRDAA